MVNFPLLNLILYNVLENHIKCLILLHCWDSRTQLHFTNMAMNNDLYTQLWPIDHIKPEGDLEGRILQLGSPHVAAYFDMNCSNSLNILEKASKEKLFKHQFHWFLYDSTSDLQSFKGLFLRYQMAVDADITLALPNRTAINSARNNSSYILYDVFNNGSNLGGKLNVTPDRELTCSGTACLLKQYLSSLHATSKYERRWLLDDLTMRLTTVFTTVPLTAPESVIFAHLNSITDRHIDGVAKFGFQYAMILKENLGCNLAYNFTDLWGHTEVSGGLVGALGIEETADLATSPYIPSTARAKYTRPLIKVGYFRNVCVFRTPQNAEIKSDAFLQPFSERVWVIFGITLLIISILLWLTFLVELRRMKTYLVLVPSFLTTCLICFGSACYQSSFLVPSTVGGRITFMTLSLFTFIFYNYYTSIVVAILLNSPIKSNIKTMGQLADSKLEVGLVPIPYTTTFLNISTLPEIKRFVRNKIDAKRPEEVWLDIDKGLRRVRDNRGYVFVIDSFSGYPFLEQIYSGEEICDLNEILLRPEQPLYFHINKNSSYREIVQLKNIRIMEAGILERHQRLWIKRIKCQLTSSSLVQVGLEFTAPLFIMLAAAYILVLLLLLLEICWAKLEMNFKLIKTVKGKSYRLRKENVK